MKLVVVLSRPALVARRFSFDYGSASGGVEVISG